MTAGLLTREKGDTMTMDLLTLSSMTRNMDARWQYRNTMYHVTQKRLLWKAPAERLAKSAHVTGMWMKQEQTSIEQMAI